MSKRVVIVGGGIAGLSLAYYLNKASLAVTVVDRSNLYDSASCGNAGFLSMFDKSPFAYPGVFRDTFAAFCKGKNPMTLNPGIDLELLRWGYHFYKAASHSRLRKTLAVLEYFGEEVFSFYENLTNNESIECGYKRDGFALIFSDPSKYRRKLSLLPAACPNHQIMSRDEIAASFPLLHPEKISGVIKLRRNGQVEPELVIAGLHQLLERRGVEFKLNQRVIGFQIEGDAVGALKLENSAALEADEYVVATGSDRTLATALSSKLVMTSGRGYSLTFKLDQKLRPTMPALFVDIYTAITPRKYDTRITGRIEFGRSSKLAHLQVEKIVQSLKQFTTDFQIGDARIWAGDRPLTADDMPYVGRDRKYKNCSFLTGMGHTGMNIGPVSARVLSEILINELPNTASPELLLLSGFYQG